MTRSHKIGWIILAVALLFMLWRLPRLHGQGFGSFSHDQPFLAGDKSTTPQNVETQLMAKAEFRWVALDLASNNTIVTNWNDRIQSKVFTNSVNANRPINTDNGVLITRSTWLTNETWTFNSNTAIGFVVKVLCPLDGNSPANTYPPIWSGAGLANEDQTVSDNSWGLHWHNASTAEEYPIYDSLAADTHILTPTNFAYLDGTLLTMVFSLATTNVTATPLSSFAFWTNGVMATNNTRNWALPRSPISLGHSYYRDSGPRMYVREVWVWTNTLTADTAYGNQHVISPALVSNFNYYAWDKYGSVETQYVNTSATLTNATPAFWFDVYSLLTNNSDNAASYGEQIKFWGDKSGNGKHLSRQVANTKAQATLLPKGGPTNGPCLVFENSDADNQGMLTNRGTTWNMPNTIVMVYRPKVQENVGPNVFDGGSSAGRHLITHEVANNRLTFYGGAGTAPDNQSLYRGLWYIIEVKATDATTEIYTNGVAVITGGSANTHNLEGVTIGNYWTADAGAFTYNAKGRYCEVILYNKAITAAERTNVTRYLAGKYGIKSGI